MKKVFPVIILGVLAAWPSSQVSAQQDPEEPRPPMNPELRGPGRGGWGFPGRSRNEDLTEAQREVILEFVREHSPRRWQAFADMPDSEQKRRIERVIIGRNRVLLAARERGDMDLFNLLVERVEAEDEGWALSNQLRDNPASPDEPANREALRVIVAKLVDLEFRERDMRLQHLRDAVTREETALAEDRQKNDAVIEQRVKEFISGEYQRGGRGRFPGGGPGPGFLPPPPPGFTPPGMPPSPADSAPPVAPEPAEQPPAAPAPVEPSPPVPLVAPDAAAQPTAAPVEPAPTAPPAAPEAPAQPPAAPAEPAPAVAPVDPAVAPPAAAESPAPTPAPAAPVDPAPAAPVETPPAAPAAP